MKKIFLLGPMLCWVTLLFSQIPANYYAAASGKSGKSLKTALCSIVDGHTVRSYSDLWTDFRQTDVREDGKVWDMYSSITNYTFGVEQGKNYKQEGDSYNREHSFPKSWFDDAKPMYTDLFHLVPTDGYVNGRRSNYPFGETKNPTWTSSGSWSKLGPCSIVGYSGTVFEPNDEYKGDFARIYFYMATRYEKEIAGWSSPMLSGDSYSAYADWALLMLLRWAEEDPVSQKEIDRNNAVYEIQNNRNPYVDYPGLEQYVWGQKKAVAFDPENYEQGGTPDAAISAPVFSLPSGQVERGTVVTITSEVEGAYIYYCVNGGDVQVAAPPVEVVVNASSTIEAYTMLGTQRSETATAVYTVPGATIMGEHVYYLVEDEAELKAGMDFLIICEGKEVALSASKNNYRDYADVTLVDGAVSTEVNTATSPRSLVLGGEAGAWTFFDGVEVCYLALTSSDNKLHNLTSSDTDDAQWNISVSSSGTATIVNKARSDRSIQYNASSPRFACYKSKQQAVAIYAKERTVGIEQILGTAQHDHITVYNVEGRVVSAGTSWKEALKKLPRGLYIVGGKKIFIK